MDHHDCRFYPEKFHVLISQRWGDWGVFNPHQAIRVIPVSLEDPVLTLFRPHRGKIRRFKLRQSTGEINSHYLRATLGESYTGPLLEGLHSPLELHQDRAIDLSHSGLLNREMYKVPFKLYQRNLRTANSSHASLLKRVTQKVPFEVRWRYLGDLRSVSIPLWWPWYKRIFLTVSRRRTWLPLLMKAHSLHLFQPLSLPPLQIDLQAPRLQYISDV